MEKDDSAATPVFGEENRPHFAVAFYRNVTVDVRVEELISYLN